VPYDYWSQYGDVFGVLIKLCLYATFVGFAVSFVFLFAQFIIENHHGRRKILGGSLIGAFLIALNVVLSLVTVTGLSCFSEVNLTWLSVMSIVLSVGFSVEYSVQIVSRWLRSEMATGRSFQRVHQTMSFLMIPTFMSFVSSTLGVVCLALAEFTSTQEFFFRPLIIVMFVTYFFGCWFLPVLLCYIDFDVVKLGKRPFDNDNATCPVGRATLIYVQGEATESTDEEVYIAERNVRPNDSSDQQNLEPPDNIITVPSGPSTNEEDERPEERVSNEVGNITAQQPSNSTTSDDTSSGPHASRSPQLSTYSSDDIYLTESDPCSDSIQELASHEQLSDDAETVKTGQVLRKQPPPKLNSLKESTAVTKTKSAAHIAAGRVPVDVLEKLDILIEAHRTGVTATVVGSTTAQPAGYREKEDDSIPALQKGAFFSTEKLERGNVRNDEMTRSSPKRSRAATPPQRTTTDLQMKELDEKWMERQRIRETCVVLTELQEKWMKIQLKREKAVVGRNNTDIVATYPPTKDSETCHPTDKEPINGNIASQESAKKAVVADNASVRKEKSSEDDSDSGIIASYSTRSLTSSSDVPPFTVTSDKDCLEKPKGEELEDE
jgi:Patched family